MYLTLAYVHLATVLPAFLIGTLLLVQRKGSLTHRRLGRVYMILMLFTAVTTLFMPAAVGPQLLHHFGFIHLLSVLAIVTVPSAYFAARKHNLVRHRNAMLGLYFGGILIAGSFALAPGRMLHGWLFG